MLFPLFIYNIQFKYTVKFIISFLLFYYNFTPLNLPINPVSQFIFNIFALYKTPFIVGGTVCLLIKFPLIELYADSLMIGYYVPKCVSRVLGVQHLLYEKQKTILHQFDLIFWGIKIIRGGHFCHLP